MNADALETVAARVYERLRARNERIVFAESCTGGKMAAAMTTVPGVSEFFCGSAVVYRESAKTEWLGVPEDFLKKHTAVSQKTSQLLAANLLRHTSEAELALAITGHLGPNVEAELDGICYVAFARRSSIEAVQPDNFPGLSIELTTSTRVARQEEAATEALKWLLLQLQ